MSVYLITGVSSGLGYDFALVARDAGHTVIGTVRSKTKSAEAVGKLEAKGVKIVELDVSKDKQTVQKVGKECESIYGHIDVLVNNAGFGVLGATEDFSEEDAHSQFNTNVFGPLFLIQSLLPGMRARKSGTIVNVSSVVALDPSPAQGLYASSKFALEGLSETLAREIAPFNLSVLVVEFGAFRTNFLTSYAPTTELSPVYKNGPVEEYLRKFDEMSGKQAGDPVKGAKAIVEAADAGCRVGGERVLRLPLGNDCVARYETKVKSLNHDLAVCRAVAGSTDVDE